MLVTINYFFSDIMNNSNLFVSVFGYKVGNSFSFYLLDQGFYSAVQLLQTEQSLPKNDLGYKYKIYRSADNKDLDVTDQSSYILQQNSTSIPAKFVVFINSKMHRFDVDENKYVEIKEELDLEKYVLFKQTKEIANSRSTKNDRFREIQKCGLQYKYQFYKHLSPLLLENREVIAQNYIMLSGHEKVVKINPLVTMAVLASANYCGMMCLKYKEFAPFRAAVMQKFHIKNPLVLGWVGGFVMNVALYSTIKATF